MRLLERTLPHPADNLALDEALLLEAEAGRGGEVLRLWESPTYAVVLGSGGILADDVDETACAADGVPIVRRSSGGGTVLLGPGCLCFSLVLAFDRDPALGTIASSYEHILDRIGDSLADARRAGTSDLTSAGRKFSGNAQQRKRTHLLHHGTLLYAFDVSLVERYLRLPPRRPEYRAARGHLDFLTNLPLSADALRRRLRSAWDAEAADDGWPREEVARLVAEKYGRAEWTRRR